MGLNPISGCHILGEEMAKKHGKNKKKCEVYKLRGTREKNKELKAERYKKKMLKAKLRKEKKGVENV